MERIVEQGLLYDFYGELLTEHQRRIYEDVVLRDLSLTEIAQEEGISRQGVHDLVRRCDRILAEYEQKLKLIEKFHQTREKVEEILRLTEEYDASSGGGNHPQDSADCRRDSGCVRPDQEDFMAFESLSDKLQNIFKNLRGKGRLSEADVKAALKEVKMALLEADVSFKVVKQFISSVQERAVGQDVLNSLTPGQMVVKIVHEELVSLMGSETTEIALKPANEITVILMAGLQGAGKTTTTAKIAGKLKAKGRRPLLAACDVYRPAAIKPAADQRRKTGRSGICHGREPEPGGHRQSGGGACGKKRIQRGDSGYGRAVCTSTKA